MRADRAGHGAQRAPRRRRPLPGSTVDGPAEPAGAQINPQTKQWLGTTTTSSLSPLRKGFQEETDGPDPGAGEAGNGWEHG